MKDVLITDSIFFSSRLPIFLPKMFWHVKELVKLSNKMSTAIVRETSPKHDRSPTTYNKPHDNLSLLCTKPISSKVNVSIKSLHPL